MSKKERYEVFDDGVIKDNVQIHLYDTYQCCVLLNQQHQKITELEKQLEKCGDSKI